MTITTDPAALAAQLAAAQRDNARLIARIVELEAERDAALLTIRKARQRLYDAHGRGPETVAAVIRAVGAILRDDGAAPPRAQDPPPHCWNCGLPLVGAHVVDEVAVARAGRTVRVHRACADHLVTQGWQLVAQARGLADE